MVQVNLYAGNEYYFSVAATDKAKKMAITLYDETGAAIPLDEPYQEGATAAVGFSPEASGPYYVKVEEVEGVHLWYVTITTRGGFTPIFYGANATDARYLGARIKPMLETRPSDRPQ